MVTVEMLEVNGTYAQGVIMPEIGGAGHPNMIAVIAKKGYLFCGYLNMAASEKFDDAAVLGGGASFEAILANPIKGMTPAAAALGVKEGMTGAEAVAILNA